jgi:tripeptidyl-peptidase-2
LEYSFKLAEDTEVTLQALFLNDKLYESVFESQLIMVYNHAKRYMGCSDAWPEALKLKKGAYTAILQVRHEDTVLLKQLEALPISLDRQLAKALDLQVHSSYNAAVEAGKGLGAVKQQGHTRMALFVSIPVAEKLPEGVSPGDTLLGQVHYAQDEPRAKPRGKHARGGHAVHFNVDVEPAKDPKEKEKAELEERLKKADKRRTPPPPPPSLA